jgi:hypothetical protein
MNENTNSIQPNLEEVSIQLEHWRKTKKSIYKPILKKLWEQAAELAGNYLSSYHIKSIFN